MTACLSAGNKRRAAARPPPAACHHMPPPPARAAAIIGPTASGKSDLALHIAPALNAEIISVDSGAVYRGLDIGTAKPSPAARARIPHHLIDIASPAQPYNVGKFFHDACAAAADIAARGKLPLFVGGSMMYFNALLHGLDRAPPVPPAVLAQARADLARDGAAALYAELARARPAAAAAIAATDGQRIVRALCLARLDAPASTDDAGGDGDKKQPPRIAPPPAPALLLLMPAQRDWLRRRIAARLQQMWADGLLEETRRLLATPNLPTDAAPLKMAGYQQAAQYLRGALTAPDMQTRAFHATCQLAKRQLAWIRRWRTLPRAAALDPQALPFSDLQTRAQEILHLRLG